MIHVNSKDSAIRNRPLFQRNGLNSAYIPAKSYCLLNILCSVIALLAAYEFVHARSSYAYAPALALILPAILCAISRGYRHAARSTLSALWGRLDGYSRGTGSIPWLAIAVFAILPSFLLYLSNQKTIGAIDTRPVVPSAISLVTERNWSLVEFFAPSRAFSFADPAGRIPAGFQARGEGIYSSWPAGMVPLAIPVVFATVFCDTNLDNYPVLMHLEKMTASIIASIGVGLFFLIALRLASPAPALVVTATLAAGSGMFSTVSMGLWQQGGIILWSMVILLVEFRKGDRSSRWDEVIQGFACAQLVSCRLTSVSFLVPFGLWVFIRSPLRAFALVSCALIAYAPWAAFYQSTYGNPFGPSTGFLSGSLWSLDLNESLPGVLFSPARGLLIYQPWIALGIALVFPGFRARMNRDTGPEGWAWFCGSAILSHLLLISAWREWHGGWCWGSRLMMDVVPLCALLCVRPIVGLWVSRTGRAIVLSTALLGFLLNVPACYLNAYRWNESATFPSDVFSWSNPPFLYWRLGDF